MDTFDKADIDKEFRKIEKKYKSIRNISNQETKLSNLTTFVNSINHELEELDQRRNQLLYLRQSAIRDANEVIMDLCNNYLERRILYYVVNKGNFSLTSISETLDMREKVVQELMEKMLKRKRLFEFEDDFF
jgi:predicted transcriptional regulator